MGSQAKNTRPNVSGGAQGERWNPRAIVKEDARRARRYQDQQEIDDGALSDDDERLADHLTDLLHRAAREAPAPEADEVECNGLKHGTTPSAEGTAQPCEHAYWDPGPWDVGKGFGQWRFPCQQALRP